MANGLEANQTLEQVLSDQNGYVCPQFCFVWSHPQVVLYIEQSRKTVKHVHLGNQFGIDGIDRFPKVLSRRDCVWGVSMGYFRFSFR